MTVFDQMIDRGHERVCFHHDPETGLRAIIAVHSTALGNALGGTRRWYYATEADALYDVLRLSEGMTYKSAAAGLPAGGAKSLIMLPEPGFQATEAEARAMGRFVDTFQGTYIAAEDVGVTTQFCDWMALETRHVMGGEQVATGGDPSPHTAQGVVNAMKAALKHAGRKVDFSGVTVAIQGIGNVGRNVARIITKAGGKVIGADINEVNLSLAVAESKIQIVEPEEILTLKCDILSPCALGGVINGNNIGKLRCQMLVPGANNVLDDPQEDAVLLKSADIVYVPDFIANAGGVVHLAGLYLGYTTQKLAEMIARIEQTSLEVLRDAETGRSAYDAAVALAQRRIAEGSKRKVAGGKTSGSGGGKEQVHAR